jgi:hydrogenase maturation protein HypF
VALSVGCFQNAFLLNGFEKSLTESGFAVLSHQQVPPNDGGVALGQAVIANRSMKYEV